ncbi:MAG: carbohydrate ABC transporter permease [Oscillospiraceae bacterium]|nr:carbohydrate ABC transporter permease [Oscillospiraceae bacterium]
MRARKWLILCILTFVAFFLLTPLWLLVSGSLMGGAEAAQNFAPVLENAEGSAVWPLLPKYPTLQPLVKLLLDSPEFFRMFWNSCLQVFPLVAGQIFIGAPAAWAFARYDFRGKKALLLLYIVLMLMPFQVTMVSSYLVLSRLSLMDTVWAIILPGAASTFPVFIMTRFFAAIPASLTEAAALDGASPFRVFLRVGLPMGAPGILSAVVLGFFEYWNALEVPLTFLKDPTNWPLSLYLPSISADNLGISLAASVVMLVPALLIFLFGQKYLEQGICAAGLKEN